jgi:hypothetical protein
MELFHAAGMEVPRDYYFGIGRDIPNENTGTIGRPEEDFRRWGEVSR